MTAQQDNRQERIAIVGMALRYPDASSPDELWDNVLAGRRAFRRLPDERMRLADYYSPDPTAPDRFYADKAAVLEGYEFDRVAFKVAGSTFRSTDLTHWLALETASRALADAGFPNGEGLPKRETGVVVGNTLTGEFSRAQLMRLRWPYVQRVVAAALQEEGWDDQALGNFLGALEERYKTPFAPIDEDTLAGGLANTIAGRICNYFDLNGGGYTVDGACSSSLLSVATCCKALTDGDLDVAIAGGVDLSIDPFEVIGFAKTSALATGEMLVFDRKSNGFWPGEGCGMLVLMRESDAATRDGQVYGYIAGWGIASDGKGGMTRPEANGQALALERAYLRAGFGADTVSYFEGHGTGTAVGDTTELEALTRVRRGADPDAAAAALGTIKGNIGHTKAAAGVAGLIKATLAVFHRVIPPATGHLDPHPLLTEDGHALRVPLAAEPWPADQPIRAAVSAMGFGGINTHIVVESAGAQRLSEVDGRTAGLVASRQDAELLLLDADGPAQLRDRIVQLAALAPKLSYAELADLAAALESELADRPLRAALVVSTPEQAADRLAKLLALLDAGARSALSVADGIFFGPAAAAVRIAYLFPGQGSGSGPGGGALRRRFAEVDELYRTVALPEDGDQVATAVAQPRIVTHSLAGLRALELLGIEADVAVGHSLGELTALHWAGAMDAETLVRIAGVRGRAMADASTEGGTMASVASSPEAVEPLLDGEPVSIAGYNSPEQTVVSGAVDAVERVQERAGAEGLETSRLAVSHAFHSPLVAPAADALARHLVEETFQPLRRRMISTVSGEALADDVDVRELLRDQVLRPVQFSQAAYLATREADLVIEVGPGRVLTGLADAISPYVPALSLHTDSLSLVALLQTAGAAWVLGAPVRHEVLFAGRPNRPIRLDGQFRFLASPCETPPAVDVAAVPAAQDGPARSAPSGSTSPGRSATDPGRSATDPGRSTTAPGRSAAGPGRSATDSDHDTRPDGPDGSLAEPGQDGRNRTDSTNSTGVTAGDGETTLDLLRRLAAERVELPLDQVPANSHPLDDLHLSSITVGQLVNQVTKALGRPTLAATSSLATATLQDLAETIDGLGETELAADNDQADDAAGIMPWVRPFALDLVPTERGPATRQGKPGSWEVFSTDGHPVAEPLRAGLQEAGIGGGVLLCLAPDSDEGQVELFLAAAQRAIEGTGPSRFVVLQHGRGASALGKTLHLEAPHISTTLVDLPLPATPSAEQVSDAVTRVVADAAATTGFSEVHYDDAGTRQVPVFRPITPQAGPTGSLPLGADDVLLVTGGGKGITAECALALARESGAAVALLGRSDPEEDAELAANLARMSAADLRFRYVRADVTDAAAVRACVEEVTAALGPVTAVLHGAGRNEPAGLAGLTAEDFRATLAPKIDGLRAVLDAVDAGSLRLLITFGSIIGRAGLRGEAHYATANDWMTHLTVDVAREHPDCRCLALEWSVWSGAGMGERLGVLESLIREGISPIPTDQGIATLLRVLADPDAGPVVLVMSRAANLPTLTLVQRELPLLRFLERPVVHYPGIELITDATLSAGNDPYLADHLLDGDLLFPAVLGMEAMAQVAAAVSGRADPPVLRDMEFLRPIVVPVDDSITVRVIAHVRDEVTVDTVIRSSETVFGADHFRATLRYGDPLPDVTDEDEDEGVIGAGDELLAVPIDPLQELYGGLMFQGERFHRLRAYRKVAAREVVAEIGTKADLPWFADSLPQDLVLADPGTRDALMHSIQCCVPNATLLPAGLDRLWLADPAGTADPVILHATERSRDGDTFVYDLHVRDEAGEPLERWEGLRLQAVRKHDGRGPWVPPLLGPYLTRSLEDLLGGLSLSVIVEPDLSTDATSDVRETGAEQADGSVSGASGGRTRTALSRDDRGRVALSRALGRQVEVHHRPDGKPEVVGEPGAAVAHGAGVTLAITGPIDITCDVETVVHRSAEDWDGLFRPAVQELRDLLVRESGEDVQTVATRLWAATECISKAGLVRQAITLQQDVGDGWVVFGLGDQQVATLATTLAGSDYPAVFAVLTKGQA